jgi:hypothetical protein
MKSSECRVFNKEWEEQYFFTDVGSIAVFLICGESSIFRVFNLKCHFKTQMMCWFVLGVKNKEIQRAGVERDKNSKVFLQLQEGTVHILLCRDRWHYWCKWHRSIIDI